MATLKAATVSRFWQIWKHRLMVLLFGEAW